MKSSFSFLQLQRLLIYFHRVCFSGNLHAKFIPPELPAEERIKFPDKYKAKLVEQYGIIQKEYVLVPDYLLENTGELKDHFDISYDYTSSLKPKPTTKTKKND